MHIIWAQYFQIISLLLAIIFGKGLIRFKLTWFIPLLLIVCITDFVGSNRAYFGWTNNYLLYDCYLIVTFPVTYYIFFRMLKYKGWLQTIYFTVGFLIFLFFVLNLLYLQGSQTFNTYTFILTDFVFSMISLLVLVELFKDDDYNIMLYNHPYFWISGAILIFSVSTLVILGSQQIIANNKIQINGKNAYKILTQIMNVVLYTSYSYAFFLCRKLTSK
jgi:hypothetical protein